MGMTDKQFNSYVRLLLEEMESVKNEENSEKKEKKLEKIIDTLRQTLED